MFEDKPSVELNTRLPSDILGIIFSTYVEEETLEFPLETLLLICRFWTAAALEHKQIWASLKINIVDASTSWLWVRKLPLRLKKRGSSTPICFTLRALTESTCRNQTCAAQLRLCDCTSSIHRDIETIFDIIFEPEGSLYARLKKLDVSFVGDNPLDLIPLFSYPTPQLISLSLHNVGYPSDFTLFFPLASSLRSIHVDSHYLYKLMGTDNVNFVGFSFLGNQTGRDFTRLTSLFMSRQVRRLELDVSGGPVNSYLLDSESIFMVDAMVEFSKQIKNVWSPELQELSINIGVVDAALVMIVVRSCILPLHQIKVLGVAFPERYYPMTEVNFQLRNAYTQLLRACENIEEIHGDKFSTSFLLKLLRDDSEGEGVLLNRTIHISDGKLRKELRAGKTERMLDIDDLAREIGWLYIEKPWEEMVGRPYGAEEFMENSSPSIVFGNT